MNLEELIELKALAEEAARRAGEYISNTSKELLAVRSKSTGSSEASQLLTDADIESQKIIYSYLKYSIEKYDLGFLAEESVDDKSRLEKEYFWAIDPLDGTLPFVEGIEGYSISIALLNRKGIPQLGVVYDPVKDQLYSAIKGQGAYRDEEAFKAKFEAIDHLTVIVDRSFKKHASFDSIIKRLDQMAQNEGFLGVELITEGAAVMNACWVLEKSPACYFKFPKKEEGGGCLWDFAATSCIFNETASIVSDIYGHRLDLNRSDSTFLNHKGVLFASDHNLAGEIRQLYIEFGS